MRSAKLGHFLADLLFAQHALGHEYIGERPLAVGLNHQQPHQFVARHQAHLDRQVAEPHIGRFALSMQHVEDVARRDDPFFQRQLPDPRQRRELGLERSNQLLGRDDPFFLQIESEVHGNSWRYAASTNCHLRSVPIRTAVNVR